MSYCLELRSCGKPGIIAPPPATH